MATPPVAVKKCIILPVITHPDPIVHEVLDIWTPRFLVGGIAFGDLVRTVGAVRSWRDWGPAWMATAAEHEGLAEEAWDDGRRLSAVQEFLAASRCYHLSYFLSVEDETLHHEGLRRMVDTHDRVLEFQEPPVEKVRIPFGDTEILGLFSRPRTEEQGPVVIVLPGLDSTKETRHAGRGAFLRRGMAVLSLDGPGQGEMSLRLPIRPDYEVAVTAAIDFLETRDDVDPTRIGVSGSSLGGYYAARAAAFEPRVRATVTNCGPYDWAECFDDLPVVTREAFRHYSGSPSMEAAKERAAALTLRDTTIDSPLFVIQGGVDPLIPVSHGERIAGLGLGEVVFALVEGGGHSVNNLPYRVGPRANDWLARHLGGVVA